MFSACITCPVVIAGIYALDYDVAMCLIERLYAGDILYFVLHSELNRNYLFDGILSLVSFLNNGNLHQ